MAASLSLQSNGVPKALRILQIEDCPADAELALLELSGAGFEVSGDLVDTPAELAAHLSSRSYDLVLADYSLPGWSGIDALQIARQYQPDIPFILVTGTVGEDIAVDCLKQGVTDVVLKTRLVRLPIAVRRALEEKRSREERELAQRALAESEARYRNLVEASPDAIFVLCDNKIVFANSATLKLLAAETPEQVVGKAILEFVHPDCLPIIKKRIEADLLSGPASAPTESVHVRLDGSLVDVEGIGIPITWQGLPAIEVMARDITERKRADRTVVEWQKRLELAERATLPLALWDWDFATDTLVWSDGGYRLLGYTRSSFRGTSGEFLCRIHPQDLKKVETAIQLFISGSETFEEQFRIVRPDGSMRWLDARGAIVNNDGSRRMIGILIDITKLRRTEADYRSMVETAPYGIIRSTLGGRFLLVNPALTKMLGYESESELLSLNIARDVYCKPEVRAQLLNELIETGYVTNAEREWKRKDGKIITVSISVIPVRKPNDEIEALQSFIQDVTERKSLERQFWISQKMEAVGRLAGGVAHDFNNVLMVVGSYAELIQQHKVDEIVSGYADKISKTATRAVSITRQLLAFSRQQMLEPEVLDLNGLVTELTKVLPRLLGEDITVVETLDPGLHRTKVDRGQMEQILVNLAVNSRDAMPKGGRFELKTQNVELADISSAALFPMNPGSYIKLSVADTGTGMSAETRSRIFEPFFTTKERGKGTGLGLATVYGIVKQSGGFIWVTSDLGCGTTFEIYFPRVQEPITRPSTQSVPAATSKVSETILLVEDDVPLREAIREYLQSKGYTVLAAACGTEAMRICEQHTGPIDAILTDLVMPGMDGVEVVNAVARHCPGIHIMYMSGYTDRAAGLLSSRAVLLRKPFGLSELAIKLRSVLATHNETSN